MKKTLKKTEHATKGRYKKKRKYIKQIYMNCDKEETAEEEGNWEQEKEEEGLHKKRLRKKEHMDEGRDKKKGK